MKYFKISYGYDRDQSFPITGDELHKANVIAMEGGKAIFENGFFQNRDKDIMRIEPDWHRIRGWNSSYKMQPEDFEDVKHLQDSYRRTMEKAKLLAEFIVKENKRELLSLPAIEAWGKMDNLLGNNYEMKKLYGN